MGLWILPARPRPAGDTLPSTVYCPHPARSAASHPALSGKPLFPHATDVVRRQGPPSHSLTDSTSASVVHQVIHNMQLCQASRTA